jgi:hypothetical protein
MGVRGSSQPSETGRRLFLLIPKVNRRFDTYFVRFTCCPTGRYIEQQSWSVARASAHERDSLTEV